MAENENSAAQADEPQFVMQRIYLKDASFEAPSAPVIFIENWEPKVDVDLNTTGTQIQEGLFEVVLTVTVTAKLEEKTAYLAEIKQAGIFNISGFNEQDLGAMVNSYCPNMLFPFAREAIADLVNKGSFPQMLLAPINFDALYAQHLQQAAQGESAEPVH